MEIASADAGRESGNQQPRKVYRPSAMAARANAIGIRKLSSFSNSNVQDVVRSSVRSSHKGRIYTRNDEKCCPSLNSPSSSSIPASKSSPKRFAPKVRPRRPISSRRRHVRENTSKEDDNTDWRSFAADLVDKLKGECDNRLQLETKLQEETHKLRRVEEGLLQKMTALESDNKANASHVGHLLEQLNIPNNTPRYKVTVTIFGACGLTPTDACFSIHKKIFFCVCELRGRQPAMAISPVSHDCLDPRWNHTFSLPSCWEGDTLRFRVCQQDVILENPCVGVAEAVIGDLDWRLRQHIPLSTIYDGTGTGDYEAPAISIIMKPAPWEAPKPESSDDTLPLPFGGALQTRKSQATTSTVGNLYSEEMHVPATPTATVTELSDITADSHGFGDADGQNRKADPVGIQPPMSETTMATSDNSNVENATKHSTTVENDYSPGKVALDDSDFHFEFLLKDSADAKIESLLPGHIMQLADETDLQPITVVPHGLSTWLQQRFHLLPDRLQDCGREAADLWCKDPNVRWCFWKTQSLREWLADDGIGCLVKHPPDREPLSTLCADLAVEAAAKASKVRGDGEHGPPVRNDFFKLLVWNKLLGKSMARKNFSEMGVFLGDSSPSQFSIAGVNESGVSSETDGSPNRFGQNLQAPPGLKITSLAREIEPVQFLEPLRFPDNWIESSGDSLDEHPKVESSSEEPTSSKEYM